MELTSTGYKVTLASGVTDTVKETGTFFENLNNEGIWYAMTGKHFGEWCADVAVSFVHFLVDISDVLLLVAVILLFFVMFGSVRVRKWLYWTVIFYLIMQVVGDFV